ncbi:unnamed protein product [Macrosiphum euphorbiae]|uniref:Uncharacterized protein n=1 Tax=Macrosiphum euphorbiae TaxID=13131 RepID=A0AAV0WB16_9HEMI|nr:unnamed protein product [Macrosiphum euphorbiae]
MDQNKFRIGTSYLERNKHYVQANRESEYNMYNNLPSTTNFSQSTHEGSRVQSKVIEDLQSKVFSLNVTYQKYNNMVHQFKAELAQVKTENDTMNDEIAGIRDSIFDIHHSLENQLQDNFNIATKTHKHYQRSKNLLIFNIPDSMGETPEMLNSIISELLRDIGFNNEFPEITRFGIDRDKDRPILLVFKSPDYVQTILKQKNKLCFFKRWQKVKIGRDLTVNQR